MVHRVMVIAGEASGDLHGAGVVRELKRIDSQVEVFGVGGDSMQREGMELVYHIRELSFMGFVEVLKHVPFLKGMERTLEHVLKFKKPDVLVLIDYPGFNLRFARIAKKYGVKVIYYISPQIWAWHRSRINTIRDVVDLMLVIFPFEVDLYRQAHVPVEFVGNPLLEVVKSTIPKEKIANIFDFDVKKPILALLPGSRKQEIDTIFPAMLEAAKRIKKKYDCEIILAIAPTLEQEYFRTLYDVQGIHLAKGMTYDVVAHAQCALVTSGTATLETAILGTPMVIVYRTSWTTYMVGRLLVRVRNIGLVNIVAGKTVVPECIQHHASPRRMAQYALEMLLDPKRYESIKNELLTVRKALGSIGASKRVAEQIVRMFRT
ncbi:MAG: lipid-A-disaccharide synthase [Bacteroidetes bacterium]|nr:lipid-A-disaccharide synthase [Bacteroidota bacterium]